MRTFLCSYVVIFSGGGGVEGGRSRSTAEKDTGDYENVFTHFPPEIDTWSPILKGGEAIQC